jgi:hypothetical protein
VPGVRPQKLIDGKSVGFLVAEAKLERLASDIDLLANRAVFKWPHLPQKKMRYLLLTKIENDLKKTLERLEKKPDRPKIIRPKAMIQRMYTTQDAPHSVSNLM